MKLTFIYTSEHVETNLGVIEKQICEDQNIPFTVEYNTAKVMKLSRGHQNPAYGFCMVDSENTVLKNYFDLIDWINKNAFRQI